MKTEKRKFGDFGESIALKFLMKHGFELIERNYLKPWGEIDIIVKKGGDVHFVEVKSVSVQSFSNVSHETIRPEDNIHPAKLNRMYKAIQTYMLENSVAEDKIHADAIIVRILDDRSRVKVSYLQDIGL